MEDVPVSKRDYLTVDSLSVPELHAVLDLSDQLKADRRWREDLHGRSIGLIFEKPSTRTRISFDVAIRELGGHPVVLNTRDLQLGRGETIEDTARVLSRYLDAMVVRTFAQSRLETLASAGTIPVINALSDFAHPCQALADLQTIREVKGGLAGVRVAYLGDGNNVAESLLRAGAMTGMHVTVACPPGYEPTSGVVEAARLHAEQTGGSVRVTGDPAEAASGVDVLYTDVWTSMGRETEHDARLALFRPYSITSELLATAAPDAIVLHCLPAHRDQEIAAEVLDGEQSVVWDQAENRLHTQKALLLHLLTEVDPERVASR